ncbi:MAG TPA: CoA-binding protein [Actinomycetota bacterium]
MSIPDVETVVKIYEDTKTIAVVGASGDPDKPSHSRPAYLQSQGYRIIPVSPRGGELFGEPVVGTLGEIAEPVDVVNVFRPSDEVPGIAREAVALGAKVLWVQPGIEPGDGESIAADAGLIVVSGICMASTHGQLGLGPGPD